MEELAGQPCAPSKLKSVLHAVSLVEKAGSVPLYERLSSSVLVRKLVDARTAELERGMQPTRRAPPILAIMVASLEVKVCDEREPLYFRAFAWSRLFKVWTSSRADDLQGILPEKMVLGSRGLQGVFDRTKTSGAGRKTRWLPFFVSRHAFLVEPNWLEVGFKIWQGPGFNFSRDYLLPLPDQGLNACALRMALYGDMATMAKSLHSTLTKPRLRGDKWEASDELIFPEAAVVAHFREHSERNFMTTLATWAGVDRDRRMYLGRWCVVEMADEYVRSASYVVHALQVHVAPRSGDG